MDLQTKPKIIRELQRRIQEFKFSKGFADEI
jgi:hypothetical protein